MRGVSKDEMQHPHKSMREDALLTTRDSNHRRACLRHRPLLQQPKSRGTLHQRLISAGECARQREADAKREQGIQRICRHRTLFYWPQNPPCFANLAAGRHIILKERLTAAGSNRGPRMARGTLDLARPCGNPMAHGIFAADSAFALDVLHTMLRS